MNIRKIAELAGVSSSTVSRVFNHHPGIKENIRAKVMAIARENGYHPRFSERQKNVVIITPYNGEFPVQSCVEMILNSLVRVLPERGFRIEILPLNNLDRMEQIQFCGAVAIGGELSAFPGWAEKFTSPLIIMDRKKPAGKTAEVCFIRSDEAQGMESAIRCLAEQGHTKIGCIIHGTPERGNALIRCKAIEKALKAYGCDTDPLLIRYSGDGSEKYVELIGKMLRKGTTALFCPGGNAGIVSLYAMALYNKCIPDDISLISSEQTAFSQFTVPSLTTITPDYTALSENTADVLEKWIDGELLPEEVTLPYKMILRESTGPARRS